MAAVFYQVYRNFSADDGTNNIKKVKLPYPSEFGWARDNYDFVGWNTARNGSGTMYQPEDRPVDDAIPYYAIWHTDISIFISYAGSQIATMSSSGTKTLLTSGKYCTDNIIIDYTKTGITVVETLDSHGGTIVSISGDPVTSLQAKTVIPTSQSQTISADSGYDAISEVLVQGDNNLVSSNIASGVSIFGVVGTFAGGGDDLKNFIEQHETMTSFSNSTISVIGTGAFYRCSSLTTLSLPACTSIGSEAFGYCSNLLTVSFSLCTNIGSSAFLYCYSLATISFPACTSIGSGAFAYCSKLTTVSFPSCTYIAGGAFSNCYSLTTASFPLCTYIGISAFYSCSRLTTADFPSCTSISNYAFEKCYSLTTVSFSLCTSIGSAAFSTCQSLTTASFPSCTTIGSYAFYQCYRLTTVSFPLCTRIGIAAFSTCQSLTTASFPSCTTIDQSAFYSCVRLATASFPSCSYIGTYAFRGCYSLLSLYLTGSSVAKLWASNAFSSTPIAGYTTATDGVYGSIFVPFSLYSKYIASTNWVYFSSRFVSV